jgi:ethanolamine ammonia-lyase large subunit
MLPRRVFLQGVAGTLTLSAIASRLPGETPPAPVLVGPLRDSREDLAAYMQRIHGGWVDTLYKQLLGAANEFKEGDAIIGVVAADAASRHHARQLLANTPLATIAAHPPLRDELFAYIEQARRPAALVPANLRTLGDLKEFLLAADEAAIHAIKDGLSSDIIGCVVKLMSDDELVRVSRKIANPLPGSRIGAHGYLGARIQPNSPTDHVDDIRWQVLDGFAYAVGDCLLGTNPVSSNPESVLAVEQTLQDILDTFGIADAMPHCVLAHIDIQAEVEQQHPGSTALWFQSIAGSDTANATFDLSLEKMRQHARARQGRYGLYFETGQGADFTNGHGHGYDMVLHESRKYGFARALADEVAAARGLASRADVWNHVNDVAGFIGPEVFRTREQLVRCCLEDLVMGKLHGLTIGLDVCSTLHMDVTLDDLDWCLEQIAPAAPAYLMALPTKIDPMLGYLTTGYQDHVRLREQFGFRVNDRMWAFFQDLGVVDAAGRPTEHFGDPLWVYLQYRKRKQDPRSAEEIREEGQRLMREVRGRGVFLAEGYGSGASQLKPQLDSEIRQIYADAKKSIWCEWDPEFVGQIPDAVPVRTLSLDRSDYILHPASGEVLDTTSQRTIEELRLRHAGRYDVQLVVSEGLNALALMEPDNLFPLVTALRQHCARLGKPVAPHILVVTAGRVRAGYRIGETLFGGLDGQRTVLHLIGERPGSGHHTISIYLTRADGAVWKHPGGIDHDITRVVSGISTTALAPRLAAAEVAQMLHS